jgi:hypothetical protein
MPKLLFEYSDARVENIGGHCRLHGCVAKSEFLNANKRWYPRQVYESAFDEMQPKIKNGSAFGMLGHSMEPGVQHEKISHVIESVRRRGNDFIGTVKLIPEGAGKIAKAILDAGGKLGFSTKSIGEVERHKDGYDMIKPGLKIHSIDLVGEPSSGEFAKALSESILSESLSVEDSALAIKILHESLAYGHLEKWGHGLADQQRRVDMSNTWDDLFAGNATFPSLTDHPMASKSQVDRLDDECFEKIMELAGLQNSPSYNLDQEGMTVEFSKYYQLIQNPIKRRQAMQMYSDARSDRIRRQRSDAFLAHLGKYNR